MKRTRCAAVAALVVALTASAAIPATITDADVSACTADAVRFCRSASNLASVVSCLKSNRSKISRSCQAALRRHGV
jgi:hypothetical protein